MPRPQNDDRFTVFALTELERDNTIWDRVGVAYVNQKDGSINVYLRATPVSGKLQLRRSEEDDKDKDADREARPRDRNRT